MKLSGPLNVISCWELNPLREPLRSSADVAVDIARSDVDKHEADRFTIFAAHFGRASFVTDIGKERDGHLRASRRWNEHAFERVDVLAKIARVSRVDRITLAAFHGGCDVFAADGRLDDVIHIADFEAVARGGFAVDSEIEKITADGALGERAACIGHISQLALDLHRELLDFA